MNTNTIYVEKTVRETKELISILKAHKDNRKVGEIVIEARERVQLEVAGFKPYTEMGGFDLFFEESREKKVVITAKPVRRDSFDRLADLITFSVSKKLAY